MNSNPQNPNTPTHLDAETFARERQLLAWLDAADLEEPETHPAPFTTRAEDTDLSMRASLEAFLALELLVAAELEPRRDANSALAQRLLAIPTGLQPTQKAAQKEAQKGQQPVAASPALSESPQTTSRAKPAQPHGSTSRLRLRLTLLVALSLGGLWLWKTLPFSQSLLPTPPVMGVRGPSSSPSLAPDARLEPPLTLWHWQDVDASPTTIPLIKLNHMRWGARVSAEHLVQVWLDLASRESRSEQPLERPQTVTTQLFRLPEDGPDDPEAPEPLDLPPQAAHPDALDVSLPTTPPLRIASLWARGLIPGDRLLIQVTTPSTHYELLLTLEDIHP